MTEYCTYFDNTSSYITVPDSGAFTLNNASSFSIWINPTVVTGGGNFMSHFDYTEPVENKEAGFDWDFNSTNHRIDFFAGVANSAGFVTDPANITTGIWTNIGITYDGTTCIFYQNGVATGSGTIGHPIGAPNQPLQYGLGNGAPGNNGFYGYMCHGMIFNTVLGAPQMLAIYNFGRPSDPILAPSLAGLAANLVCWHPLGAPPDSSTGMFYDVSGNGHHGTGVAGSGTVPKIVSTTIPNPPNPFVPY